MSFLKMMGSVGGASKESVLLLKLCDSILESLDLILSVVWVHLLFLRFIAIITIKIQRIPSKYLLIVK